MNTQRRGSVRTALAVTLSAALATTALAMVPAANAASVTPRALVATPPTYFVQGESGNGGLSFVSAANPNEEQSSVIIGRAFADSQVLNSNTNTRASNAYAAAFGRPPNTELLSEADRHDPGREERSAAVLTQEAQPGQYTLRDVTTYAEASRYPSCPTQPDPEQEFSSHAAGGATIGNASTPSLRAYLNAEQQRRYTQFYTEASANLQTQLAAAAAETTNEDTRAALLAAIPRAATLPQDALDNPAISIEGLVTRTSNRSPNASELYAESSVRFDILKVLGGAITTTQFRTSRSVEVVDGVPQYSTVKGQFRPAIFGLPVLQELVNGELSADFGRLALDPGGADFSAIERELQRIAPQNGLTYVRLSIDLDRSRVVGRMNVVAGTLFGGTESPFVQANKQTGNSSPCIDVPPPPPPPVQTGRITIDTFIPPKSDAGGPLVYRVECRNGYFERVEARGVRGERTSTTTGLIELGTRCTVTPVSNGNFGGETPPAQDSFVPGRLIFRGPAYLPPTGGDDVYDPRDLGVGVAAAEEEEQRIATTFSEPAPVATAPSSWSDSCPTARDREPVLVIPRLRKCWRVGHDGLGNNALDNGPQRYPGSVDPGRQGVAAIAAHRTTHDSPFYYLDRLREGDKIRLRTTRGTFTYEAVRMNVVKPDVDNALKALGMRHRLVLTTCSGGLARRLVVQAVLLR